MYPPVQTTSNPNPAPTGAPSTFQQPSKSGCGCCGCLFGCILILLIPPLVAVILYFTVDFGKVGDQGLFWAYENVVRPRIEEQLDPSMSPSDKKMVLEITDSFVNAYRNLPSGERKEIRRELLTYFYYNAQNQPPPPEEVRHLNRFVETQMEILKQKYPQLPSDPLRTLPRGM